MIFIGTSGFSYADWRGGFYPADLAAGEMLAYYAQVFSACEMNATYYRIPTARSTQAMVRKSGGRVQFVVKAHHSMTHDRNAGPAEYAALREATKPFADAQRLGGILAQFPYAFVNTLDNRGYLLDLKNNLPGGTPVLVEFRHRSWMQAEVFDFLRDASLNYVIVDEPALKGLMPVKVAATGEVGYFRFHGRNREKWFKRDAQPWERYDYLYSLQELQSWVEPIRSLADTVTTTFVFFNNHWQSQAVTNARQMADLLGIPLPANPAAPQRGGRSVQRSSSQGQLF